MQSPICIHQIQTGYLWQPWRLQGGLVCLKKIKNKNKHVPLGCLLSVNPILLKYLKTDHNVQTLYLVNIGEPARYHLFTRGILLQDLAQLRAPVLHIPAIFNTFLPFV